MLNKSSVQAIHPDDVEGYQAMLKQLRSGTAHTAVYSFRALARNGSYVWMEGRYRMMMHPITGKPQEIIASTRDISERVAAEEELRTAYRNLERLASTDSLTSLANRRTFDQTLEREWRRAMRERTPLALLLLDVDYFKNYNDTLGHPAGDEVLRRIGNCLGDIVQRPGDLAARYGGEEFVALLPITDEAGALHIANRIMEAVAELGIPHPASMASDRLTLSIGIASLVPVPGTNPESLVDAADRALYEVKRKSRNGVAVAGQVAGQTGGLFAVEKPAGAPVRTGTSA
jgi:diguanylate cyclase (GGDEF)-like protein